MTTSTAVPKMEAKEGDRPPDVVLDDVVVRAPVYNKPKMEKEEDERQHELAFADAVPIAPTTETEGEAKSSGIVLPNVVVNPPVQEVPKTESEAEVDVPQGEDGGYVTLTDTSEMQKKSSQFVWISEGGVLEMQEISDTVALHYKDNGWTHGETCETCVFFVVERCEKEKAQTPWNARWPACGLWSKE